MLLEALGRTCSELMLASLPLSRTANPCSQTRLLGWHSLGSISGCSGQPWNKCLLPVVPHWGSVLGYLDHLAHVKLKPLSPPTTLPFQVSGGQQVWKLQISAETAKFRAASLSASLPVWSGKRSESLGDVTASCLYVFKQVLTLPPTTHS